MISFMKLSSGAIRLRVYQKGTTLTGTPGNWDQSFSLQAIIPAADWTTILAQVGTPGGNQAGTAGTESNVVTYEKSAGELSPLEGAS